MGRGDEQWERFEVGGQYRRVCHHRPLVTRIQHNDTPASKSSHLWNTRVRPCNHAVTITRITPPLEYEIDAVAAVQEAHCSVTHAVAEKMGDADVHTSLRFYHCTSRWQRVSVWKYANPLQRCRSVTEEHRYWYRYPCFDKRGSTSRYVWRVEADVYW
jgi:hypothetical protein